MDDYNACSFLSCHPKLLCQENGDFDFVGESSLLWSAVGIFTMCFCRPSLENCTHALDFRASLGLFTTKGPFYVTRVCEQGRPCAVQLVGIGLNVGDRLVFRNHSCQSWSYQGVAFQVFMELPEPLRVKDDGNGLEVDLGTLPFGSKPGPGIYRICWCPADLLCTSASDFRGAAGELQIHCPPGDHCFPKIAITCNSYRFLTSNDHELAVRAFETGCRCWCRCCELAVCFGRCVGAGRFPRSSFGIRLTLQRTRLYQQL